MLLPTTALAVPCNDYSQALRWIARSDEISGGLAAGDLSGRYGYYLGWGPNGSAGYLRVMQLNDPYDPTLVGTLVLPSPYPYDLVVDGDFAYVADWSEGLVVVDVSDPASPFVVGAESTPFVATDVEKVGDIAYVSITRGLVVMDVSDPGNPSTLAWLDMVANTWCVEIQGDFAYLANPAGLQIVDIVNPQSPIHTASVPMDDARKVFLRGAYAYVSGTEGLIVVDIDDPTQPARIGAIEGLATLDLSFQGNRAVGVSVDRFQLLDFSNPELPVVLAEIPGTGSQVRVDWVDQFALVGNNWQGLEVYDTTYSTAPEFLVSYPLVDPSSFLIDGQRLLIGFQDPDEFESEWTFGRLEILDLSDPLSPSMEAELKGLPNTVDGIASDGDLFYLSLFSVGIQVYDLSVKSDPVLLATIPKGDYERRRLLAEGGYLYVVGGSVEVYDVSNPSNPVLARRILLNLSSNDFAREGDYFYVLQRPDALGVIDVSVPKAAFLRSTVGGMTDTGRGICAAGGLVLVANDFPGLAVFDVSDPDVPLLTGEVRVGGNGEHIEFDGRHAYVAAFQTHAFEVAASGLPIHAGQLPGPRPIGLQLHAEYLYYLARDGLYVAATQCDAAADAPLGPTASPELTLWPNPSRGAVDIALHPFGQSVTNLRVFDPRGRLIRSIPVDRFGARRPAGFPSQISWDGCDRSGRAVPSGVYYVIGTGGTVQSRGQVVILR